MNKTSISIGATMLLAAAAGIYFDDLAIRIAAGAIFIAGAVLLYLSVSRSALEEESRPAQRDGADINEDEDDGGDDSQPLSSRASAVPPSGEERGEAAALNGFGTAEPARRPAAAARPRMQRAVEIPVEYYHPQGRDAAFDDPRAEFDSLTGTLLQVLKDHLIAHTVAVFWMNLDRQQIVIGEFLSDAKSFTTARRIPFGTDLVSLIGTTAKPQILPEIGASSEQDLLCYYDTREGVQSFVGVPVFFEDEPIAVLVADSTAPDAFGIETVATMGRFTSFLSQLLASYNQKFDLAADSRMLGVSDRMRKDMLLCQDVYGVASAAIAAMSDIMDWDYLAVILYNQEKRSWTIARSQSKSPSLPYVSEGVTVNMEASIFRAVFDDMSGRVIDTPQGAGFRFHEKEAIASSAGQLCVAPIANARRCMGLLVVEYRENHQYGSRDIARLMHIAELTGLFLDAAWYSEMTRKYLLIDDTTMVSSRALLFQRITEEHARIQKHGGSAVFFLAGIDAADDLQVRHGQEGLDVIMAEIGKLIRNALNVFDVIGRYDGTRFGLLLLNTDAENAYLRAEKLRKAIAGYMFSFTGTSFSVTASFAGCAFTEGTPVDQVLKVSQQAMNLAIGDSGNCVKVV